MTDKAQSPLADESRPTQNHLPVETNLPLETHLIGPRRILHFFTLSAFGIAQPLLSEIPVRLVFLHDFQPRWPESILYVVCLMLVVPSLIALLDFAWVKLTRRRFPRVSNAVLGVLLAIVVMAMSKPLIDISVLQREGISWAISLIVAVTMSVLLMRWLKRSKHLESWLMVCSFGIVIFPGHFLWQMSRSIEPVVEAISRAAKPVGRPVPVVMIVFDEFSGLTLQNEDRQIDAARFPHFARLAKTSNWYRNATTASGQTIDALPTLLSGLSPNPARRAIGRDYPQNLFQLIHESQQYEMVVFEPVSRLCDEEINDSRRIPRSLGEQLQTLCRTTACAYPHFVLTADTPLPLPAIPREWFGLAKLSADARLRRQGLIRYFWDGDRDVQINHFLDCVRDRPQSEFYFMHVVLPHFPWQFLPSGNYYVSDEGTHMAPLGTNNENWCDNELVCSLAWQKYLLQVGYMDHWLGQLLDRLKDEEIFDECLLIVTADHGVSFRPGHSRRKPHGANLAEIMSIPLFVKLPGQSEGQVIDRNAESIDVFPTIADVLQQPLSVPVDGASLLDPATRERPRKTIVFEKQSTIAEPDFPEAKKAHLRQLSVVGSGSSKDRVFRIGPRSEWIGRSLDRFTINEGSRVANIVDYRPSIKIERGQFVPALIDGQMDEFEEQAKPLNLVCAVDGVIQATSQTINGINRPGRFAFMLPEHVAAASPGTFDLFAVVPGKKPTLERLRQVHFANGNYAYKEVRPTRVTPERAGTPKTLSKP